MRIIVKICQQIQLFPPPQKSKRVILNQHKKIDSLELPRKNSKSSQISTLTYPFRSTCLPLPICCSVTAKTKSYKSLSRAPPPVLHIHVRFRALKIQTSGKNNRAGTDYWLNLGAFFFFLFARLPLCSTQFASVSLCVGVGNGKPTIYFDTFYGVREFHAA